MTDKQLMRLIEAAQKYDVANRSPMQNWSRVPDQQVARLILGALATWGKR